MPWGWRGTENSDRHLILFCSSFLILRRGGGELSQLELHVALKNYLKGGRSSEIHFGAGGSWTVWFSRCWPSGSSLPLQVHPGSEGCLLKDLSWLVSLREQMLLQTLEGKCTFQKLPVQFRETQRASTKYNLPAVGRISKLKTPLI